jgi:hypothetical protein
MMHREEFGRLRDIAMSFRLTMRIIAPTMGASVALLLLGGVAALCLHWLQQDSSELLVASVNRLRAAEELEIGTLAEPCSRSPSRWDEPPSRPHLAAQTRPNWT